MADSADRAKAYQDQLVDQALARHKARPKPDRESAFFCKSCGDRIPDTRRQAVRGTEFCAFCATPIDKRGR